MFKIAVQITTVTDAVGTIAALRRIDPDTSIDVFRSRIASSAPVAEYVLFNNDYVEVAARLRALVRTLPETGATLRVFLLEEEKSLQEVDPVDHEITVKVLANILASAEEYE